MTLDPGATRLDDQVAVVTGGGGGIGRGIAQGLAAFGAVVAVWEIDDSTCAAVADEVGGLGIATDVREPRQVDAALARTIAELGPVSVLVNNVGGVTWGPFLESTQESWDDAHRTNLGHVILCTHRVAHSMVDTDTRGSIINVATIEGVRAAPGYAAYAAAKAGVVNFTKTTAVELGPHGIRVNALAPDLTITEAITAVASPRGLERACGMIPLGRTGHVDDLAGAAVFLASRLSAYVTGQTIHVDGGTSATGGWYHHPDSGRWVLGPQPISTGG